MTENVPKPWFESWFDTAYYHLLYRNRDETEAHAFVERLLNELKVQKGSVILDVACGKGRHSISMANMGMQVTGIDISENSIKAACNHAHENLHFEVQDMRLPFAENRFDAAVNLFTSFGYFEDEEDDLRALRSIWGSLKSGGVFIQDYLNGSPIIKLLPETQEVIQDHVQFSIRKSFNHPFIYKHILVKDNDTEQAFTEKVRVYTQHDFIRLHEQAGFEVQKLWGNYQLGSFDADQSPRIILVSKKP